MARAAFQRVTAEEIPEEWRRHLAAHQTMPATNLARLKERIGLPPAAQLEMRICCELPDYPICREWMDWHKSQPEDANCVDIMISSRAQWSSRQEEVRQILHSLLTEGRPKPIWASALHRVA